jgi:hypothetical protein
MTIFRADRTTNMATIGYLFLWLANLKQLFLVDWFLNKFSYGTAWSEEPTLGRKHPGIINFHFLVKRRYMFTNIVPSYMLFILKHISSPFFNLDGRYLQY